MRDAEGAGGVADAAGAAAFGLVGSAVLQRGVQVLAGCGDAGGLVVHRVVGERPAVVGAGQVAVGVVLVVRRSAAGELVGVVVGVVGGGAVLGLRRAVVVGVVAVAA